MMQAEDTFRVRVRGATERALSFRVSGLTTIRALKERVAFSAGIPSERISLWRFGHSLSDLCQVSDLASSGDSTTVNMQCAEALGLLGAENLHLNLLGRFTIKIVMKEGWGGQFIMGVSPMETLQTTVNNIHQRRNISIYKDIILYRRASGVSLDTGKRIHELAITPGTRLTMEIQDPDAERERRLEERQEIIQRAMSMFPFPVPLPTGLRPVEDQEEVPDATPHPVIHHPITPPYSVGAATASPTQSPAPSSLGDETLTNGDTEASGVHMNPLRSLEAICANRAATSSFAGTWVPYEEREGAGRMATVAPQRRMESSLIPYPRFQEVD